MDLANDDNFATAWVSSPAIKEPWWKVELDKHTPVSMVVVTERGEARINELVVEALQDGEWKPVATNTSRESRVHICRFTPVKADGIRVRFTSYEGLLSIAEIGVYDELPKIPKNN
jgi:alpha-L-fucosidase